MLTEHDARAICTAIIRELKTFGATVKHVGIQRDGDGLLCLASLNGRVVFCQIPPGTTAYRTVATDLLQATGEGRAPWLSA